MKGRTVAVISASKSDEYVVNSILDILREFSVEHEVKVISAHRKPEALRNYVNNSKADLFIAIAGLAAHLPGVIASLTIKPVIGVPVSGKLGGLDALLSIVQMPKDVPVASVGIDNGKNAGILAIEILAINEPKLKSLLKNFRKKLAEV